MKKYVTHCLVRGALVAAALASISPAAAEPVACSYYQPGLLAALSLAPARPVLCEYQGPYIVKQGPVYDGPAIVAPQATYAPSRTLNYVHGPYHPVVAEPAVRRTSVKRTGPKKTVVDVKNELPATKGKPQVVRARAEVRIYGPERMDIRLYRR
jgi:hypothetical protein